jgi:FixJ family two-component response regulator
MGGAEATVFVVDDDESLRRSVARFLRASGLSPSTYGSAEDFLADPGHHKFDCLLVDIQLDGMSGLELNERLRGMGSAVPVVFITAQDEPETRERALRSGCAAYLLKSEPGEALLAAITRVIREHTDVAKMLR